MYQKTVILVEKKTDRSKVVTLLKKELVSRMDMDETVWGFDAQPSNALNYRMLELLESISITESNSERVIDGVAVPTIVVAWGPDSVGVTFFKKCFVLMTYQPNNLREFIQNVGRSVRGGGDLKK